MRIVREMPLPLGEMPVPMPLPLGEMPVPMPLHIGVDGEEFDEGE